MGRLTEQDEQGNWCVKGLPWKGASAAEALPVPALRRRRNSVRIEVISWAESTSVVIFFLNKAP